MITDMDLTALEARCAKLEKFIGLAYLDGAQLSEADFRKLLTPANEVPTGDYSLGIGQKLTNYIDRDQATFIAELAKRLTVLELKPSPVIEVEEPDAEEPGGVGPVGPVGPKGDKGDTGPMGPAGSGSGSVGVLPGFGTGWHLVADTFEALIFVQGPPDNALRILTNHKANGDGGFTHANKKLGQQRIDIETFGVGVSYWTPLENEDGTPFQRTELDKKGGKSIVLRSHSPDNHRAPYAQIYAGLPGQGLQIGVSRNTANVMENPSIQIEPDGTRSI